MPLISSLFHGFCVHPKECIECRLMFFRSNKNLNEEKSTFIFFRVLLTVFKINVYFTNKGKIFGQIAYLFNYCNSPTLKTLYFIIFMELGAAQLAKGMPTHYQMLWDMFDLVIFKLTSGAIHLKN